MALKCMQATIAGLQSTDAILKAVTDDICLMQCATTHWPQMDDQMALLVDLRAAARQPSGKAAEDS